MGSLPQFFVCENFHRQRCKNHSPLYRLHWNSEETGHNWRNRLKTEHPVYTDTNSVSPSQAIQVQVNNSISDNMLTSVSVLRFCHIPT